MVDIHGISKEKWVRAFADAVEVAIDKGYFSDTLFFYLYPDAPQDTVEDFTKLWSYVDDAFKEVFGFPMYGKE